MSTNKEKRFFKLGLYFYKTIKDSTFLFVDDVFLKMFVLSNFN